MPCFEPRQTSLVEMQHSLFFVQRDAGQMQKRLCPLSHFLRTQLGCAVTVRRRWSKTPLRVEQLQKWDLAVMSIAADKVLSIRRQRRKTIWQGRETQQQ